MPGRCPFGEGRWIEHDDVIVTERISFEEFKRIGEWIDVVQG